MVFLYYSTPAAECTENFLAKGAYVCYACKKGGETVKILVSACLLGENCKYNGGNNKNEKIIEFLRGHDIVAVCPEKVLGVPRVPMEIVDGVLIDREGRCVDEIVRAQVARIAQENAQVGMAILKSRSPTCGVKQVYDGTFSGRLTDGMGTLARALKERGVRVVDAEDI